MRVTHAALRSLPRPASPMLVTNRGRAVAAALIALLAAGGCSSGGESAEPTEAMTTTTGPDSALATDIAGRPLVTTTAPAAPAVSSPAIVGLTLQSTSTTLAPAGSEEALEVAVGSAEMALLNALREPENEQLLVELEAATVPASPARAELVGRYRARVGAGPLLEPSVATPSTVMLESTEFFVDGEQRAVVTVCVVDGDVLVRHMVAGDDVEVVVIDEQPASARFVETFALVDQEWRLESRVILDYFSGGTSCPAS